MSVDESESRDGNGEEQSELRRSVAEQEFPVEEYRLVPAYEWEGYGYGYQEESIDWMALFRYLWGKRLGILKITAVSVFLGVLVALFSAEEYESSAMLMPEYSTSSQGGSASQLLQKYGGLIGLGGGTYNSSSNAIRVELYPQIIYSVPLQMQLLEVPIPFGTYDTTATIKTFYNEIYRPSPFSYVLLYTLGLPGIIKGALFPVDTTSVQPGLALDDEILNVSKEDLEFVEYMRQQVTANLDVESGVVTVTSRMPDPYAAAAVGNRAFELLKRYLKEYRTEKLKTDLAFVQEQYGKARERFVAAQNDLAEFRDKNYNLRTAKSQTELERLQSEYDLAFNVYNSLAQQLEQAKMKLQEQTPLFKTLQPFMVPVERSSPKRTLMVLVFAFLGGVVALGYYGGWYWWVEVRGER
jgi:uncharacterized protein involved in exopolysaccharide biosynthesis